MYTNPPEAVPPENWRAVYNSTFNTITVSWESSSVTTESVTITYKMNGEPAPSIPEHIKDPGQQQFTITGADRDINKIYDITLTAKKGDNTAPVTFTIVNAAGGMTVDAANPVIKITSENFNTEFNNATAAGGANVNKQWVLSENVSLTNWTPIGIQNSPFMGRFYGNGNKITVTGFANNLGNNVSYGIFGHITDARISNLNVDYNNINVQLPQTITGVFAGGIAGTMNGTNTIQNCSLINPYTIRMQNSFSVDGQLHNSNEFKISSDPDKRHFISSTFVYIVNRPDDPGNGNNVVSLTPGTLRHAVLSAPSGSIVFIDRALVGDTITLTRELQLVRAIELVIEGNGIIITKRETSNHRFLWNGDFRSLTIRNVHFKGGYRSSGSDGGAAIKKDGSVSLTLESCIFSDNNNPNTNARGGAIHKIGSATMIIRGCTFYNNTGTNGSAIYYEGGGLVTLSGNLFYGNTGLSIVNDQQVTSSYNIFDRDFGTGDNRSGIPAGTGDATLATVLGGSNTNATWPFDGSATTSTNFIPRALGTLWTLIPATEASNMPAVDFYGKPRTWPGPPGAVVP